MTLINASTSPDPRCKSVEGDYVLQRYTPTVSDTASDPASDPARLLDREYEIQMRELDAMSLPPGVPVEGKGPEIDAGIDVEWVHDAVNKVNIILSVQFHLIGECGEFTHIHYTTGTEKIDRPEFAKLLTKVILLAMEAGVVLEWPKKVNVCAFFLRADLTGFRDLAKFKNKLRSVAGAVGTRMGIPFDVEFDDEDIERLTRLRRFIIHNDERAYVLNVTMIDLVKHVPVGYTLNDIGKLLGQEKVKLKPGDIERMDLLLRDDPELYAKYALQDSLIAVYYLNRLRKSVTALLGRESLPLTCSGVAVALFKKTLREQNLDMRVVFGTEPKRQLVWNERTEKINTVTQEVPSMMRGLHAPFIAKTAHGGRGECMYVGPTEVGEFHDIDVRAAYPTALSGIGLVDMNRPYVTLNPEDFRGNVAGFALVEFSHPEDVRYPVFAVESGGDNLLFTRTGISYCTAPEIEVALNLKCEVRIIHGVIYPWLDENIRPFESFVHAIREGREKHPKGSFDNEYIKLVGNGLTGKTGQGVIEKMVFDAGKMRSVTLEKCEVTQEMYYSLVTGTLRALTAELMAGVPAHRKVFSVATDGFLTDASLDEIDQSGPLATRFKAMTQRVAPGSAILERKHFVSQLINGRIRAQFTSVPVEGHGIVLAKGNVTPEIQLPEGEISKEEIKVLANDYMCKLYLERTPASKTLMRPFISLRQQWIGDLDVFRVEKSVRLGLEFDMKREPVNPRMMPVLSGQHIAFDTRPWESVGRAELVRAYFDVWRRKRCLKDMDDWNDWQGFLESASKRRAHKATGGAGINRTAEGDVGMMRRVFLRAYAKETWGLKHVMGYVELAAWLTERGYPTTETELKNAKRAKLCLNVVAATEPVIQLVVLLKMKFTSIDIEKFIGVDGAAVVAAKIGQIGTDTECD